MNRNYILKHWQDYNLVDSYSEMINLLNILEVQGETIDSLHDVALNGYDEFCGIIGKFDNDRDTVNALFEFHRVFENKIIYDEYAIKEAEDMEISYDEYIKYEDIRIANDGQVVVVLYY